MRYLVRRLWFYILAFFGSLTINFFIPRMMPGDPVSAIIAKNQGRLKPEQIQSLREAFGFTQGPLLEQFGAYLGSVFSGNFGVSVMQFPVPVSTVIAPAIR